MCSRDLLFYINTFCFIYEPRPKGEHSKILPFITYKEFQDEVVDRIDLAISKGEDLVIEKSRDVGATWMCITALEHRFHFKPMESFLMLSRIDDLVDKTEDPRALFWKIDFIHRHQPKWMMPRLNRQKNHLLNMDNGSTIDGAATTGEAATGDRRTAIFLDEFAKVPEGQKMLGSTRDATRCRIFNSTHAGQGTAFHDLTKTCPNKLRLHWSSHPEKNQGLYYDKQGRKRSPWYDEQCRRSPHPGEIKQNLDIDVLGSNSEFFDGQALQEYMDKYVTAPLHIGELDLLPGENKASGFNARKNGRLKLWFSPDPVTKRPPKSKYCMGIDVSAGTGASNSVISIGNMITKEKIAEYTNPLARPEYLAQMALALAEWFSDADGNGAYMIWEANGGPGHNFGSVVMDSGYRNVYYRTNESSLTKRVSDVAGWFSTIETKMTVLGELRRAMKAEEFVNRSKEALDEYQYYIFLASGCVGHAKSESTEDASGARANHGDHTMADALMWKGMKGVEAPVRPEPLAKPGSMKERMDIFVREQELKKAEAEEW